MPMKIVVIYIIVLIVSGILYMITKNIYLKKSKKSSDAFLERYPDAVKVYTQRAGGFIVSYYLQVYSVNGEDPASFMDEEGNGFYCKVGKNVIGVEYSTNRPGILHRNVTKSTGGVEVEIETKAHEKYYLYFDKESQSFQIDLK